MLELKECTVVIPFYYDSKDRLNNLDLVLDYLNYHFKVKIVVSEQVKNTPYFVYNRGYKNIEYFRTHYDYSYFHKTRLINDAFKECVKTECFLMNDCDAIFNDYCINNAYYNIIEKNYYFSYPYNRKIAFVPIDRLTLFKETFETVDINLDNICLTSDNTPACGLGFICNSEKFKEIGMMNQNFAIWGEEDWEFLYRVEKLEYEFHKEDILANHLEHYRNKDGTEENSYMINNKLELNKVYDMDRYKLLKYIETWGWK